MTQQIELKHFLENDTMTIDEHLRLICQAQGQASTPSQPPDDFSPSPMLSWNSSLPKTRPALSKSETHLLPPHQYFLLVAVGLSSTSLQSLLIEQYCDKRPNCCNPPRFSLVTAQSGHLTSLHVDCRKVATRQGSTFPTTGIMFPSYVRNRYCP